MAKKPRRSGLSGVTRLRRKLRNIDKEITKEVRDLVREGLYAIERDALGLVPVDTGDLAHAIEVKISSDGFTGVVGPGVKAAEIVRRKTTDRRKGKFGSPFGHTSKKVHLNENQKDQLLQFFKGYWIEFGTKGNAERNIPPQPARPFMGPAYEANKGWMRRKLKAAIDRALERAATGE